MMEGPGADSEEKHEPVSDIDTAVVVVGLKALDPEWPIREAIDRRRNRCRLFLLFRIVPLLLLRLLSDVVRAFDNWRIFKCRCFVEIFSSPCRKQLGQLWVVGLPPATLTHRPLSRISCG
jgi:hypothetical protein